MLVVMEKGATKEMVDNICREIEKAGLKAHPMPGALRTAIGVTGNKARVEAGQQAVALGRRRRLNPDRVVTRPGCLPRLIVVPFTIAQKVVPFFGGSRTAIPA